MDYNLNLQMEEQCRICLQKGDINIWNSKVTLKTEEADDSMDKTFFELIDVFNNQQELLVLTNEFPCICCQCLEDLKFCCIMYEKIKLANIQLNNLYEESINQYIDEEHLIEYDEEQVKSDLEQINGYDQAEVEKDIALTDNLTQESYEQQSLEEQQEKDNLLHINRSKHITLNSNDAFVITQFVPTALETPEKGLQQCNKDGEQNSPAPQHLLTMNLKAVEVKDLKNLETSQNLDCDNLKPAIYVCQYCPQAFTKSDYLKTHIQKSHVCKFCCQAFGLTEDLFRHIREAHTEHKCAICHKILSSHTNLRHHIRRVHRINLPAKVTLIDFIKSSDKEENQRDILQDVPDLSDMDPNIQFIWENEDSVEALNEHIAK